MELKITQEGNTFYLAGVINEFASFQALFDFQSPQMILNLREVTRINSTGVREWINAIEKIDPQTEIIFEECPTVVVYQINMIPNFISRVKIRSIYTPHFCESCQNQEDRLIEIESFNKEQGLPEMKCSECGSTLEFEDEEESYFYFLELTK